MAGSPPVFDGNYSFLSRAFLLSPISPVQERTASRFHPVVNLLSLNSCHRFEFVSTVPKIEVETLRTIKYSFTGLSS